MCPAQNQAHMSPKTQNGTMCSFRLAQKDVEKFDRRIKRTYRRVKESCVSRSNKPPSVFAAFGLALYPDYWIR